MTWNPQLKSQANATIVVLAALFLLILVAGAPPAAADTTPPTTAISSPSAGAQLERGVETTISGTATDPGGETTGGQVAGVEVSTDGGLSWNAASGNESWSYPWTPSALGSATIRARAIDDSGNLESPGSQVAIEIVPPICPCSLWDESLTAPGAEDPESVELGVKLRSDVAGVITGIRFYKTAGNSGQHVGRLWTEAGVELAVATFTGETATGWQTVTFDQPVAISANTTYVAAYHTPSGNYASLPSYFALGGHDNDPLHALADGVSGENGVFRYGEAGDLFANGSPQGFNALNYLVDAVFDYQAGTDTTPPLLNGQAPANGATGIGAGVTVSATFNEAMSPATINGATVQLREPGGALVAAAVSYSPSNRQVSLDPSEPLSPLTTYTVTAKGGTSGIKDLSGNPLASDSSWSFTTAPPPPPPPGSGPGGPILVISNEGNPFSSYYAEILRAEGLNEFAVKDLAAVTPAVLGGHDVAILGEGALSSGQAQMLEEWVSQGGNLIAMRPSSQLAGLLGLTPAGSTLANAYLKVDTSTGPGTGIVDQTIQFHGTADRYTPSGAQTIATLFNNATTASSNPAVTLRSVGTKGGQAASFTYDLAKSVVYTRQGNPAWSGEERDGMSPIRPDDLFFGAKAGDVQPDWIDLNKVAIPQADEQQRLLTNLIERMNVDRKPLPRFWFLPRDEKAAVVMTGDDHGNGGTIARFHQYEEESSPGCSVAEWQCVRATSYIYPGTPISNSQAADFTEAGFELALHTSTNCGDWDDQAELDAFFSDQLETFSSVFPDLPAPATNRTHCIAWGDWATQPRVESENGIRLDTNYYYWPASWVQNRPGMFTGSGMPMRFAETDGTLIDVYQAATQFTDESNQVYPFTSNALLNNALGSPGYYGVFTANIHTDKDESEDSDGIIASAKAHGVPVISARQLLTWLDGRDQSSFGSLAWAGNELTFTISAGEGATGLRAMVPTSAATGDLVSVRRGGTAVPTVTRTIKGIEYAFFDAVSGAYTASYGIALTATEPASPANANSPKVIGSAPPGSTVRIYTTSNCSGSPLATASASQLASGIAVSVPDNSSTELRATATSSGGSVSPCSAPLTYVEDSTSPNTQIDSSPPTLSPSAAAEFKFSGSDGAGSGVASFQCRRDSTEASAWQVCTSPQSYSSLADGAHTFEARAIDKAGNTDASPATFNWTIDTTAPNTQVDSGPPALSPSASAELKFSGSDGAGSGIASFQCRVDSSEASAWVACTSPQSYSSLADGAHAFEVRAIDKAGNVDGSPAIHGWTIDATAPQTQVDSGPPTLSASASAELKFSGTDGAGSGVASFQCRRDSTEPSAWAPCTSPQSYSSLADGAHIFEVRAIDKAGNTDASPAVFNWTVDTTAPNTQIDVSPPLLSASAAAEFKFSGNDGIGSGVASFQCRRDSTEASAWVACTSPQNYSSLSDGAHIFEVRTIDKAGNTDGSPAIHNWTIDATAPQTQVDEGPPALSPSAAAEFEFSGSDGAGSGIASFQCRRDSMEASAWVACTSPQSYASLADGAHTFEVRALDKAGNVDASPATHDWTIDTAAPQTLIDEGPPALSGSAAAEFEFSGNDGAGSGIASFQCRRDSTEASAWVTCSSPREYASLADGAHTFEVRAIDKAGNTDASPAIFEWTIDTTAPQTQIELSPPALSASASAEFEFSGADGSGSGVASFECRLDSTEPSNWTSCTSPRTYGSLGDGAHKFEVRAIDQAGNVDPSPASFTWTVDTTAPQTQLDSGPPVLSGSAAAELEFSGADGAGSGVASFQCRLDSTQVGDWGPCSSPKEYASLADGAHKFEVRAIDKAGNVDQSPASHNWTVDTTAPALVIDSLSKALLGPGQASEVHWHANENGAFELRVGGSDCESGTLVDSGTYSDQPSVHTSSVSATDLLEGQNTLRLCLADAASNRSSTTALLHRDTTAPDTQVDSGPPILSASASAELEFSGSDSGSGVASYECRRDSTEASAWVACSSPQSYASLADGPHVFQVRAIDVAGNVDSSPATFNWTIDTTAPSSLIDSGPLALSPSTTAELKFSGNDGAGSGIASFQCRLDSTEVSPWQACTSPQSYASLSDGAHTFEVRAIDKAGNFDSTPATLTWTVDATAPTTQIDEGPPTLSASAVAEFTFSGNDGAGSGIASFQCRLDSTEASAWQACTSPQIYSSLADEAHTFEVRAIDKAGNVDGSPAIHSWTIDTIPPSTQIDEGPPTLSASASAEFEFSGNDGLGSGVASFQCRPDSTEPSAWAACSSPREYASLADGAHTFEVRAIDKAGNTDASPAIFEWTIDTTAPQTQIDTNPPTLSASAAAEFTFSGIDEGGLGIALFECRLDSAEASAWGTCTSPREYASLADGAHKFEVRTIDKAGNVDLTPAVFDWTVDTTAPQTQIDSSPPTLSPSAAAEFKFSGSDGAGSGVASFQCRRDSTEASAWQVCTSPQSYSSLADGAHTFEARAIDKAGNTDASPATFNWTIDTTAPNTQVDSGPPALSPSASAELKFSGSDGAGSGIASFQCRVDSSEASAWVACTSPQSYSSLADGAHAFEVRAIDKAGNVDGSPAIHGWTIDATAPQTQVDSGPPTLSASASAELKFSGTDGAGSGVASFQCRRDSTEPSAWAPCTSPQSYSSLADGAHIFEVRAIDKAGNTDASPAVFNWTVDTTAPNTQIDVSPPLLSASAAAEFKFSGNDGIGSGVASFQCRRDSTEASAWVACTSPQNYSSLSDGAHIFEVRTIDKAGNTDGSPAIHNWTIDATAPQTQVDEGPPALSPSAAAEFEFSGSDGAGSGIASFQCRRDSMEASAWVACTSPQSYASLADGAHTFEVRALDKAGNVDASPATHDWTIDTAAPQTLIDEGPPALSGSAAAEFEFSGNDGAGSGIASFQCRRDSTEASAWVTCSSPREYASLADGAHTFEVRAIDKAGNTDASPAIFEWTIDTTAPQTQIELSPPALSASASAEFEFSGADGSGSGVASFECRLDSTEPSNWTSCTSPRTYGSLGDGAHKFEVRAIDQAGNVDPSPASFTWTVDTTAPQTQLDSGPPVLSGSAAAELEFSGADGAGSGVASFQCRLDSTQVGDWGPCSSPKEYASLADGAHKFEVRAIDKAGNVDQSPASHNWTVDTTAPALVIDSLSKALLGPGQASEVHWHANENGAFELRVGGSDCESGTLVDSGTYSDQPSVHTSSVSATDLLEGQNTLRLCLADAASNRSSTTALLHRDTTAPDTQVDSGPPILSASASAELEFSGSDSGSGVASYECRRDSTEASAWVACSSPQSYASLADGPHVFQVRAIDVAGNVDSSPATFNWTIDTTAPSSLIDSGPSGLTNDSTPTFAFHASEPGSDFECSLDTGAPSFGPCSDAGSHTPAIPLTDGPYVFRVRATDAAGNQGASTTRSFTLDTAAPPAPQLTATLPPSPANENSPKLLGTAPAGSTVRLYASIDCSGSPLATVTAAQLQDGVLVSAPDDFASKFSANATSAVGNPSGCSEPLTYVEDSSAPNAQIDGHPDDPAASTLATFLFSGSDGTGSGIASFQCRLDSSQAADWLACPSPKSYPSLSNGAHKFEVRAIDQAGNVDPSPASFTWTVDTTAPQTQLDSGPPALTTATSAQLVFSGSDGTGSGIASFQCRRDSTEASAWEPCSSPKEYASLADGAHKFEVRAIDKAGNVDQSPASHSWTVDTTAPSTQIDEGPPTPSPSASAEFEFYGSDGTGSGVASFQCRRDSTEASAWVACSSPQGYASLADGAHKFEVRAIDKAGNTDASPATFSWAIDTTAPDTQVDSGPPILSASASAELEFSGSDSGSGVASYECRRDSTEASAWVACSSPQSYASLADGPHVFQVRAIDVAGNVDSSPATFNWTIDTTAPSSLIDSGPSGLTNDSTPTFAFHASEPGSDFECSLDTGAPSFGPCSDAGSHTPAIPLTDGPYVFRVRATDAAGNQGASTTRSFTLDTAAPPAPQLTATLPPSPANENSPKLLGTAPAGSTVRLYASIDCSGSPLATVTAAQLQDGVLVSAPDDFASKFSANATSAVGNPSGCSEPLTYVEDSSAPNAQIDGHPDDPAASTLATFLFSGSDGTGSGIASFQCRLDSSQAADWLACPSPKSYPSLSNGAHKFEVRAIDQAGNVDPSPASFTWTVDTTAPQTQLDSGPPALTTATSAQLVFSGSDGTGSGIASFQCRRDSTEASAWEPCSSPKEYASLADGAHKFEVRAIDKAGNVDQSPASHSWTVDTTAPAAPELSGSSPSSPANENSPKILGSATAGATVRLYAGSACAGAPLATLSAAQLAEGFTVSVPDDSVSEFTADAIASGNPSACSAPLAYVEDSTSPSTGIDSHPTSSSSSSTAVFEFSGSDGAGSGVASYQCRLDSGAWQACDSPQSYSSLVDGNHFFEVRAIDEAGNIDTGSATFSWAVDAVLSSPAPTVTVRDPEPPTTVRDVVRVLQVRYNRHRRAAILLIVSVPGPGKLSAGASEPAQDSSRKTARAGRQQTPRQIVPKSLRIKKAGQVKVPLRLTPAGKQLLAEEQRLTIRVQISFEAPGGTSESRAISITLKQRLPRRP